MRLLDELKDLLKREHVLARDGSGTPADLEVQAATALLLLEAAHGDEEYAWHEHRAIVKGLRRAFGLGRSDVRRLLERAEEIRPPMVRLADITEVVRERYDEAQRLEIVRLLWRVVEADGSVQEWENAFTTHVAETLGIPEASVQATRTQTTDGEPATDG